MKILYWEAGSWDVGYEKIALRRLHFPQRLWDFMICSVPSPWLMSKEIAPQEVVRGGAKAWQGEI